MASWGEFEAAHPDLAQFGAGLLLRSAAYLATSRSGGAPRVHPVAPVFAGGQLVVFMEPTSPKGRDLRERGYYALHNGVPDLVATGGEFWVSGTAALSPDPALRAAAASSANFDVAERWILFTLGITSARANGYGDVELPEPKGWSDPTM